MKILRYIQVIKVAILYGCLLPLSPFKRIVCRVTIEWYFSIGVVYLLKAKYYDILIQRFYVNKNTKFRIVLY